MVDQEVDVFFQRNLVASDLSYRFRLLIYSIKGGLENPLVGKGFGAFNYSTVNLYTHNEEIYNYPHNIATEILFSSGLIGVIIFTLFIFASFSLTLAGCKSVIAISPLLFLSFGYFCSSMMSGNIIDFSSYWFSIILACGLASRKRLVSEKELA